MSVVAWYADVQDELRPITSGYRLVLVYKLIQIPADPQQSAAASSGSRPALKSLFHAWTHTHDFTKLLVYPLQHQYAGNVSLATLRTKDAATGRPLEQISTTNGIYWFFDQMPCYTEDDEVVYNLNC